jgi:hypothetical protein
VWIGFWYRLWSPVDDVEKMKVDLFLYLLSELDVTM